VGDEGIAAYVDDLAGLYAVLLAIVGAAGGLLMVSIVSCILMTGI